MKKNLEELFVQDFENTAENQLQEKHAFTLHIMGDTVLRQVMAEPSDSLPTTL